MTRARDLARFANNQALSVDTDFDVGINSTTPAAKLDVRGNSVITGILTATSFSGNVTGDATGLSGTPDITVNNIVAAGATFSGVLTYEDVTNVDSVGVITARSDVSIADKIIHTGDTDTAIRFPAADTFTVETAGTERLRVTGIGSVGIGTDPIKKFEIQQAASRKHQFSYDDSLLTIKGANNSGNPETLRIIGGDSLRFHTGSTGSGTEKFRITSGGQLQATGAADVRLTLGSGGTAGTNDSVHVRADSATLKFMAANGGNTIFETNGTETVRITSTGGVHFSNAELIERVNITAGKLSDNTDIDLDDGMVHYFTTTETSAAVPNITSSVGINTSMATGDTMSVTIVTTAAAAAFAGTFAIDHKQVGVTTFFSGGAPTEGGSSGKDVTALTIVKTGDAAFDVLASVTNFE